MIFGPLDLDDILDIDRYKFDRNSRSKNLLVSSSIERDTRSRSRSNSRPKKLRREESEESSRLSTLQFKRQHLAQIRSPN